MYSCAARNEAIGFVNFAVCLTGGTRQTLVFAVCLTSAHGKDDVVQHPLGSGTRGYIFAVCCPEAHGKDRCSPCAASWHTANLDGVVRQPTTVSGSARGTSFAVCRRVGTWRSLGSPCVLSAAHSEVGFRRAFLFRRVVLVLRTANLIFTVCLRNCTRRIFWQTVNSWFLVVFLVQQTNATKAESAVFCSFTVYIHQDARFSRSATSFCIGFNFEARYIHTPSYKVGACLT